MRGGSSTLAPATRRRVGQQETVGSWPSGCPPVPGSSTPALGSLARLAWVPVQRTWLHLSLTQACKEVQIPLWLWDTAAGHLFLSCCLLALPRVCSLNYRAWPTLAQPHTLTRSPDGAASSGGHKRGNSCQRCNDIHAAQATSLHRPHQHCRVSLLHTVFDRHASYRRQQVISNIKR